MAPESEQCTHSCDKCNSQCARSQYVGHPHTGEHLCSEHI